MNTGKSSVGVVALILMSLMIFAGQTRFVEARGVDDTLRANASAKTHGSGWECDRGFLAAGGICTAVILPQNVT